MAQEMFENAKTEQDFEALNKQLDALDEVMADKKKILDQISSEKKVLSAEVDELRERLQELTYLGYIVASLSNRLDKIEKKLNIESTEGVLRETERMLYNMSNELDSINAQDIDEFNLKMRLLMDFEVLSDLVEKLEEPIDKVEDFIMEFSMMFAEAPDNDTYMAMNESMGISLRLVKQALGMDVEEEEATMPEEEEMPDMEQVE
jgi:chromosome segregation ATPase